MRSMNLGFEEIEKQARALSSEEKATLARILIEDLDAESDERADELWIAEVEHRYEAYRKGELVAEPGEEVFRRARKRLG
jgi:hypothetical protein